MFENAPFRNVLIFANLLAGRGRAREVALQLAKRLIADGGNAQAIFQPAATVAAETLQSADAAIVIGGDGTLRTVAAALLACRGSTTLAGAGSLPPLLPIPMGTANLMGRHLGQHWTADGLIDDVARLLHRHRIVQVDAAAANGELFLLIAGVGIDAQIVHELDRLRRGPIHLASYLLPAMLAMASYEFTPLTVRVDGATIADALPAMCFIGNVAEYGTGFPLLPDAKSDDGLLDVCVVPAGSRTQIVRQFLRAAAGEHLKAEGVIYTRGTKIAVTAPVQVPVQLDGDPAGHTPLNVELLPLRVPFIVSAA